MTQPFLFLDRASYSTDFGIAKDARKEERALKQALHILGSNGRGLVLYDPADIQGERAYRGSGWELIATNRIRQFSLALIERRLVQEISDRKITPLIVITRDPAIAKICETFRPFVPLQIWVPGKTVPSELQLFGARLLAEVVPALKVPSLRVLLDWENLQYTLLNQGTLPKPRAIIRAIRNELGTIGNIEQMIAFGDWGEICLSAAMNVAREIRMENVELEFQISLPHKGSTDMKISVEIQNAIESADIIVLGAGDADYGPVIDKVKKAGKHIIIIGWRQTLSREIKRIADQVIYLDQAVGLHQFSKREHANLFPTPMALPSQAATQLSV